MKSYEEQIEEILSNFDFEQVKKVMDFLGWEWGIDGTPSIYQMIKRSKELLQEVSKEKICVSSTGGFEARNSDGSLSLKFVLEDCEYDGE